MQIQKIQLNYNQNSSQLGKNVSKNMMNNSYVNFKSGKLPLIAMSTDSFKTESAKKLYSKIQKYFRLIGVDGSIKDTKLLHEKTHYFSYKPPFIFDTEADVILSINKRDKNSTIKLQHKYSEPGKNDALIFELLLDKNGQMTRGQFMPGDGLSFERGKKNVRRIYSSHRKTYMPLGNDDRQWGCSGEIIAPSSKHRYKFDDSIQGAFEIFIELARLRTKIV